MTVKQALGALELDQAGGLFDLPLSWIRSNLLVDIHVICIILIQKYLFELPKDRKIEDDSFEVK